MGGHVWQRWDGKWMARWIDGLRSMDAQDPFASKAAATRWVKDTPSRLQEWANRAAKRRR